MAELPAMDILSVLANALFSAGSLAEIETGPGSLYYHDDYEDISWTDIDIFGKLPGKIESMLLEYLEDDREVITNWLEYAEDPNELVKSFLNRKLKSKLQE